MVSGGDPFATTGKRRQEFSAGGTLLKRSVGGETAGDDAPVKKLGGMTADGIGNLAKLSR